MSELFKQNCLELRYNFYPSTICKLFIIIHLLEKADVLVVGQVVLVEGEVVDVRQVHDLGHDVVQRLFK